MNWRGSCLPTIPPLPGLKEFSFWQMKCFRISLDLLCMWEGFTESRPKSQGSLPKVAGWVWYFKSHRHLSRWNCTLALGAAGFTSIIIFLWSSQILNNNGLDFSRLVVGGILFASKVKVFSHTPNSVAPRVVFLMSVSTTYFLNWDSIEAASEEVSVPEYVRPFLILCSSLIM